jgi:hypothetical protein
MLHACRVHGGLNADDELVYRLTGRDKPMFRSRLDELVAIVRDRSKSAKERRDAARLAMPYLHPLALGNRHEDEQD